MSMDKVSNIMTLWALRASMEREKATEPRIPSTVKLLSKSYFCVLRISRQCKISEAFVKRRVGVADGWQRVGDDWACTSCYRQRARQEKAEAQRALWKRQEKYEARRALRKPPRT